MKLKNIFIATAVTATAMTAQAGGDIRTGRLDNGMTYYVMENKTPRGTADFFLAQRVGSVNEEENQRGLAHFLEHMCFNGTEHFPGRNLIEYLESVGVKFGANLNAYTSTDETIYNISKVPTDRQGTLDSCLLILQDWSHSLTLDPTEIDKERGVIENEWRQRSSATNRMLEHALPRLYKDSRYGQRMPIGKMDVITTFEPQTLRDYYHKWYNPVNQAIVVVGDIDAAAMEAQIRERFNGIEPWQGATESPVYDMPFQDKPMVVVERDLEQGTNLVQMYWRNNGGNSYREQVAADLASTMLAHRFDDIETRADCPHTYLGIGNAKFLIANGQKAFVMRGVAKNGRGEDAAKTWYRELRRALRHGFSPDEFDLAQREFTADMSKKTSRAPRTTNTEYARRFAKHFTERDSEMPLTVEQELDSLRDAFKAVTADDAMAWLRDNVSENGRGLVVLAYQPEREDNPVINADLLLANLADVNAEELAPFTGRKVSGKILTVEPVPGTIVSTDSLPTLDVKTYTLSNGIHVMAKKTDYVPDQIYIRGVGPGGLSQEYTPELAGAMKLIGDIIATAGHGQYSNNDLRKLLVGRNIDTSIGIANMEESIEASTDRLGMADAMRLLYLKATDIRPDSAAFASWREGARNRYRHQFSSPVQVMGDSIHRNIFNHHPLGAKENIEMVNSIDYDKALQIVRNRFSDMADFTYYIVGDFDTDSLEDCLRRYVATLPANGRVERPKDIGYRFTQGRNVIDFKEKMKTPQAVVYSFITTPCEFEVPNILNATVFGQIVRNRLLKDLREERGITYSIKGHCAINGGMNGDDPSCLLMPTYIKVEPGHEDETVAAIKAVIDDLANNGPTEDEVDAIRRHMIKSHAENSADNAYWLIVLKNIVRFNRDMHTGYDKAIADVTPETIRDFTRQVIVPADYTLIIMRPE